MRFIHTADWHLGNHMHNINRDYEFKEFLKWLVVQISETKAEALVIAGDVFDVVNPSVEARKLFMDFLAEVQTTECCNVIVTGGNHDSGALLDSYKSLLGVINVNVVGSVANLEPGQMVFELKDRAGNVTGICAAVPYAREEELRQFLTEKPEEGKFNDAAYGQLYMQVYEEAEKIRNGRKIPLIATGHLYAADLEGRFSGESENAVADDGTRTLDVVGNLGNVHSDVFPAGFDYVALGHIHYSTRVAGNDKIRYSGSPFLLGFDEWLLPREILCVDVENGSAPEVRKIKVPVNYVYQRVEGSIAEIRERLEEFSSRKFEKPNFIELCYKRESGKNVQLELEETINSLPENISVVSWRPFDEVQHFSGGFDDYDLSEIENLDEKEIFTRLILSKNNLEKDSEEADALLKKYLPLFLQVASEV